MLNKRLSIQKLAAIATFASLVISSSFFIPKEMSCDDNVPATTVAGLNKYNSDAFTNVRSLSFDDTQYEYKSSNKSAYINSNAVLIRKEPSDESDVIFAADYATKVYIMGEDVNMSNGWTKVYCDNNTGYIRTEYLSEDVLFVDQLRYIYISGETDLRSAPDDSSDDNIVQKLYENNRFKQTGYNSDWIRIESNDTSYYLSSNYITGNMIFYEDEKDLYLKDTVTLKTNHSTLEKYNSDITLNKNDKIHQVEYNETWSKILYNDKYYYIEKSHLTPYKQIEYTETQNNKPAYSLTFDDSMYSGDIAVVLETAYSFLGTAYRYNTASRSSTDCSGLTMQCYAAVGINLPHQSASQASYGKDVMGEDLKPGDLIMFSGRYSSSISHVGIYVGDGQMIHAANSRLGVIQSDLESYCYYGGVIRAVRRFID